MPASFSTEMRFKCAKNKRELRTNISWNVSFILCFVAEEAFILMEKLKSPTFYLQISREMEETKRTSKMFSLKDDMFPRMLAQLRVFYAEKPSKSRSVAIWWD